MSYLVLARKWRPQSLSDLVGQEHIARTLANAIAAGRVHHAFLFTGARGVGKTSSARILAKSLNCEQGPTADPCQVCVACTSITNGNDVDVIEIDGASNTGVDDVRELRENVRYLPSRSRYKVFIIDEVHMLSINAFNALLKTLEEPPAHSKFILATTEPHKIPVTILSRCQRMDFRKIPMAKLVARLRQIVDAEGVEISDAALGLVARRGDGSMRDSLSTLDQVIAFCGDRVSDEEVQGLLGMVDKRLLLDTVEALLERDSHRALESIRRVDTQGYSYRQYLRELLDAFRSLVVLSVVQDPAGFLDLSPDMERDYRLLAAKSSREELQRVVTALLKAEQEVVHSSYPRLTMEMLLLRLVALPGARDIDSLIRRLDGLTSGRLPEQPRQAPPQAPAGGSSAPPRAAVAEAPQRVVQPSGSSSVAASAAAGDAMAMLPRDWAGFVSYVRKKRPMLSGSLDHARLVQLEPPAIEFGYPEAGRFHLDVMQEPETLKKLEDLASEFFDVAMKLKISLLREAQAPPSLAQERATQVADQKKKLTDEARNHPLIREAVSLFGGELAKITPLLAVQGGEVSHQD